MDPDLKDGLGYWATQPATYDGVLGGFGNGSLPRVDALGSRLFLLNLLPELCTVPSALKPLHPTSSNTRRRAVEVGAGVGRVTSDVLLHLFDDVVLVEPADHFVQQALSRARAPGAWRGLDDASKSVTFLQGTLQVLVIYLPLLNRISYAPKEFDPKRPHHCKVLDRLGHTPAQTDAVSGFDVIWCQWCLGHLSDPELAAFLKRSHSSLRNQEKSLIVVKENLCSDEADGSARIVFDEEDSSLTRSAFSNWYSPTMLNFQYADLMPRGKMYSKRLDCVSSMKKSKMDSLMVFML
ncbi:unnamed protein product [Mycena citricolor]|uniref:Alpha N-terminal protein methyltransferase 1 n=1 Tax=Mycena citricolor TaxID=2018698 RepID=A0AAD2K4Y7_9AGAR|nr:unnamed protein product [Mycena citricolor]